MNNAQSHGGQAITKYNVENESTPLMLPSGKDGIRVS